MRKLFFLVLIVPLLGLAQSPTELNGKLQVIGNQLCNQHGYPTQLRGMSSHGLQWYGSCINESSIRTLREDWGADIVRLAMYVEEGGYTSGDPNYWKNEIRNKVDMIVAQGMYAIIDWHVHIPGDPMVYVTQAVDFFDYFSDLYRDNPSVIYEICNEPNKVGPSNSNWNDNMWSENIKPFAEQVIPAIRSNNPDAIVLVGTPIWSSKPADVLDDPLPENLSRNCLYSFHFYGGSHYTQEYINAISNKLPIFMNEWGTSINKGHTGNDYENTQAWFDLMQGNNQGMQLMSWCNWSFCDKDESSAALASGACGGNYNNTSESGTFVKNGMLNPPDNFISDVAIEPQIVVHPFNISVAPLTPATLRVMAVGQGTFQYQWYKNDGPISGANSQTYTIPSTTQNDVGQYFVIVSNSFGTTTSRSIQITLEDQQPRKGTPIRVPGLLEAEDYDLGDNGVAYRDLIYPPNLAIPITTEEFMGDTAVKGLGYNDKLEYTLHFDSTGYYSFELEAYHDDILQAWNEQGPPQFWIAIDGAMVTDIIDFPKADSLVWLTVGSDTVFIEEGYHLLTILIEERVGDLNMPNFALNSINVKYLNLDCNGVENGTAYIDNCGICAGGNTGIEPSADSDGDGVYDCNDLCPNNSIKVIPGVCGCDTPEGECPDCNGELGGTAFIDNCDVCAGGSTGIEPNTSCLDCANVPFGSASIDDCGVCSGGNTGITPNVTCADCEGILNGTASIDDCGVCSGGTSGIEPNSTCSDCNGVVNGDGVIDACGICDGDGSSCIGTLTPYKGIRHLIPGKIEFEDYDAGGQDVAYNDNDPQNSEGNYRPDESVDINSGGTQYFLGYVNNGEWLKYSVTIKYSGNYNLRIYCGNPDNNKIFNIILDSIDLFGDLELLNTNSWTAFDTLTIGEVHLEAGEHVLTFEMHADGMNFDYMEFTPNFNIDCAGTANGTAQYDECGICAGGNTGIEPNTICLDCAGVLFGDAVLDNCNRCTGGSTGLNPCATQRLNLYSGWNLVSLNIIPDYSIIDSIFSSTSTNLLSIKTFDGFYSNSIPSYLNTLQNMNVHTGYAVYVDEPITVLVQGTKSPTNNFNLTLGEGWNLSSPIIDENISTPEFLNSKAETIRSIKDFESFYTVGQQNNSLQFIDKDKAYFILKE